MLSSTYMYNMTDLLADKQKKGGGGEEGWDCDYIYFPDLKKNCGKTTCIMGYGIIIINVQYRS